jgi:hypothetical protein
MTRSSPEKVEEEETEPSKKSAKPAEAVTKQKSGSKIKIDKDKLLRLLNDDDSDISSDSDDDDATAVNAASSDEGNKKYFCAAPVPHCQNFGSGPSTTFFLLYLYVIL